MSRAVRFTLKFQENAIPSDKSLSPKLSKVIAKIRRADLPDFAGVALDSACARGREPFRQSLLHVVAIWGDLESARVLLDEGADVDVPGESGCTPLHEAALQGHLEVVKLLLSRGANPLLRCEFGDLGEIARQSRSKALRAFTGGC